MTLSAQQIEQFIGDEFMQVEGAFVRETAAACREILWRDLDLSPDWPEDWAQPVVRLSMHGDPRFTRRSARRDCMACWTSWRAKGGR